MRKYVQLNLLLLLMGTTMIAQRQFEKYRKIEAYEVRPGILMLPTYTADNQICEIGLERLHYSPDLVRLDSGLSRKQVEQILDELVPEDERGSPSKEVGGSLITQSGKGLTTTMDFEHVSIQFYAAVLSSDHKRETVVDEVVATVKWKNRACR